MSASLRLLPCCPACGQNLRRGWRAEQRWGCFTEFGGPGKITPVGFIQLDAPPALVVEAARTATWATPPEVIVGHVFGAASVLAAAGWAPAPVATVRPPQWPVPSAPWPR